MTVRGCNEDPEGVSRRGKRLTLGCNRMLDLAMMVDAGAVQRVGTRRLEAGTDRGDSPSL